MDSTHSMGLHDTINAQAEATVTALNTYSSLRSKCDLKPEPWSSCSARSRIDCQLNGDRDNKSVPRSMTLHRVAACHVCMTRRQFAQWPGAGEPWIAG